MIDDTYDCSDATWQHDSSISIEVGSTAFSTEAQSSYTITYKYIPAATIHCPFSVGSVSGFAPATVVPDSSKSADMGFKIVFNGVTSDLIGPNTLSVPVTPSGGSPETRTIAIDVTVCFNQLTLTYD